MDDSQASSSSPLPAANVHMDDSQGSSSSLPVPIKFSLCDKCVKGALFYNIEQYAQVCMACYTDMNITVRDPDPDLNPDLRDKSDEGKPTVHKVEDILKSSCGMDSTSARFLAIDIVKTVMHDFGVEMPMEFGPKKKARGVDKNERITTLTEELDVVIGRLQQENVPAIRATLDSIAVMPTIKQLIVAQLDADSIKAINKGTNSTNIEHRRDSMTKVIFSQQMAAIATTEGKLKLAKEAMQLRVELAMVREYCSDAGLMNWDATHDDLLARIGA